MLDAARSRQVKRLERRIGNTPLTVLEYASEKTGATIVVKHEYLNPTGSHYDRLMFSLLTDREARGLITPGTSRLLDVSSGNSAASLAWMSQILEYDCTIIMPSDLPYVRLRQAESLGASLVLSPAGEYISGAIETMKRVAKEAIRNRRPFHLINHAADTTVVPKSMRELGDEILRDFGRTGLPSPDIAVAPIGNGSSLAAFAQLKERAGTRILAFEAAAHPRYFVRKYGEEAFQSRFSRPPDYSVRHGLLGTGPGESSFGWPLVEAVFPLIDEVALITKKQWEDASHEMCDRDYLICGRTTAAAYHLAGEVARTNPGSTVLLIAYDAAWKYL